MTEDIVELAEPVEPVEIENCVFMGDTGKGFSVGGDSFFLSAAIGCHFECLPDGNLRVETLPGGTLLLRPVGAKCPVCGRNGDHCICFHGIS